MKKQPRNKKVTPPSAKLVCADKVKVIGFLILFFVVPTLFWHFYSIHQQEASISETVEGWKSIYHLDDSVAARIKQIELDFHGNGSPFASKGARTRDEKHRHHEEISRLMSPAAGARFMQVMEKSEGRH
jgi:hypothetical protein